MENYYKGVVELLTTPFLTSGRATQRITRIDDPLTALLQTRVPFETAA